MTIVGPSLASIRDGMAVAIVRRMVNGDPVPDWMVRDFAEADSDSSHALSWAFEHDDDHAPGSSFGL